MTVRRQVPDPDGLYAAISAADQPAALMRRHVDRLGRSLAGAAREATGARGEVLCVVILRGGALLYPAFAAEFTDADFCMLGLRRTGPRVHCDYRTAIPRPAYDLVLYLDCVAGTGGTVLAARRAVTEATRPAREIAAVICSATPATRVLGEENIGMIGFSLDESESGGLVLPDLGALDAGDLFTSTATPPLPDAVTPAAAPGVTPG